LLEPMAIPEHRADGFVKQLSSFSVLST